MHLPNDTLKQGFNGSDSFAINYSASTCSRNSTPGNRILNFFCAKGKAATTTGHIIIVSQCKKTVLISMLSNYSFPHVKIKPSELTGLYMHACGDRIKTHTYKKGKIN